MNQELLTWIKNGTIAVPIPFLTHYKNLKLTEQEVVLILHMLSFIDKGNHFPTHTELSERMTLDCTPILRRLIQKGFIEIIEGFSSEGIRYEKYSLDPLWERLISELQSHTSQQEKEDSKELETDLYTCFEQEFGRPLSPFECESLAMWLDDDQHQPVIIKAALKEAVISGKLNFRYIDRILFEWKRNGIKTIDQAKQHGRKFRQYQSGSKPKEDVEPKSEALPFFNWLEQ